MFMDCPVETPFSETPSRRFLRSLGRFLPLEKFLEVDPFSLRLGQKCRSSLGAEVPDDDTVANVLEIPKTTQKKGEVYIPNEECEHHNTTHEVEYHEKYSIPL